MKTEVNPFAPFKILSKMTGNKSQGMLERSEEIEIGVEKLPKEIKALTKERVKRT